MKRYLQSLHGKRLMISGAVLYAISLTVGFIVNVSVYSLAGKCIGGGASGCSLSWQQPAGNVAAAAGDIGIVVFLIGLTAFVAALILQRKKAT